jgi:hypothetical protein
MNTQRAVLDQKLKVDLEMTKTTEHKAKARRKKE